MTRSWRYEITPQARRDLKRLDKPIRRRVFDALDRLVSDPHGRNVRQLSKGEWRLRVGDWRIRFSRDYRTRTIIVFRVLPRGRAYR